MLKTSNFLIGFLNYENNKEGEYIEKYFSHTSHTYNSKINPEQLEKYLIKKYEKIIAAENNINIDCLCISKFIKL